MKIFHFSDSHLWLSLDNTSREDDFYNNFERIIKEIIIKKPDIVIHSWDLFHTSKPSNKAISVLIKNFLKLQELNIKTIIIAWNHDTPRLSTTTHPFEIFKDFLNISTFYLPKIDSIEISWVNFITLPHIHDENIFKNEFLKAWELIKKDKSNIFISHFWISAKEYEEYTDEISWINITLKELEILNNFDYVALWHYHKQFCIKNMCYPWSWEHTSFNQKDYKIWYNLFDTTTKKIEKNEIPSRKMIDLWEIDCLVFENTLELVNFLEKNIDLNLIKDAIVKIILININSKLMLEFNEKIFLDFFKDCFYFEYKKLKYLNNNDKKVLNIKSDWDIIKDNFCDFFKNIEIDNSIDKILLKNDLDNLLKEI